MKNLKVSLKLIISFMIILFLAILVGLIGIIGMSQLNGSQSELYDSHLVAIEAMGDLRQLFASERNTMRTIILHQDDPESVAGALAALEVYMAEAIEAFDIYESTITDISEETAFFTAKEHWLGDYAILRQDVIDLIKAGRFDEAYETYAAQDAAIVAPLTSGLSDSTALNMEWAAQADEDGAALYRLLFFIMIGSLVFAAAIAIFFAFYISNIISRPINTLSAFMHRAGTTGDISLSPADVQIIGEMGTINDEIGQTISNSAGFVGHVTNIAKALESIASGDLTINFKMLSASDTMGKSLKLLVDNLNLMFGNIQASTSQVATGSKQVADGAQDLAQGATEQAATIEQLSASIGELASKTKENAEIADKTSKLSVSIKDNALKGSRQMDEMISAVKEINDASQSISKIIKTIDDIAFQTNILALNAAVEAARAGQHGKGFAVVAEEVRNLASKSAEAAKDTGNMIQNSMEKAEFGTQIAGETAISLKDIVTGISESSQLISDIALASEEQARGISQINTGVDQVAHVVHQNSATAEESAAASEQMSSQSAVLEQLLSHFKLRDSSNIYNVLPALEKERYSALTEYGPDGGTANLDAEDFGKY